MWIAKYITSYSKSRVALISILSFSLSSLNNIYKLLASNSNTIINTYKSDISIMDIDLKLKLIDNWLMKIDINLVKKDPNMNLMYSKINETCINISAIIKIINEKIIYHNTKWFNYWRNLDLEDDIKSLKKEIEILNSRLVLINLVK